MDKHIVDIEAEASEASRDMDIPAERPRVQRRGRPAGVRRQPARADVARGDERGVEDEPEEDFPEPDDDDEDDNDGGEDEDDD